MRSIRTCWVVRKLSLFTASYIVCFLSSSLAQPLYKIITSLHQPTFCVLQTPKVNQNLISYIWRFFNIKGVQYFMSCEMYLTFLHISGASHEIKCNNISWDISQKCLDFTDLHSKSGQQTVRV